MKRACIVWLLLGALFAAGCKHHTIIPDSKLALIFHDAFLANAYLQPKEAREDSLLVYEPIFERYGYTTEDVRYTIGNFSKRKSARLGDVVELAIAMLEQEGEVLNRTVAGLDTVNNIARRTSERMLRHDTLVRVTALKDTTLLRYVFDSVRPGDYRVRVRYLIDSLDENRSLRMQGWMERHDSTKTGFYTLQYQREREADIDRIFTADSTVRSLVIDFWRPVGGKRKRPHVTLRDLKITYMLPTAEAVDSLYEKQLDIRIFADDFLRIAAPNRDTLPAD